MPTSRALLAMANVITDLLAASVFHISTFFVATERNRKQQIRVLLLAPCCRLFGVGLSFFEMLRWSPTPVQFQGSGASMFWLGMA